MESLKKIRKDYGYDIIAVLFLLGIFIILAKIFVGHQGHPIIDCGREAYIPSAMLDGKVLYKDIFNPYGPFAYQLNALLLWVFGKNLSTLFAAGLVNSVIILITLYLIVRNMSSVLLAFCTSFIIMTLCVFHYYIFNFVFPYTYAAIYSLSAFLLSVLFSIYYIKFSNPKFILFAFLFMGISALAKIDFILFFPILLLLVLVFKPVPKKYLLISLITSFIFPIISWGSLIIQGMNMHDFALYLHHVNASINSPLSRYFFSSFTGMYFNAYKVIQDIFIFLFFFFIQIISLACLYPLLLLIHNKFKEQLGFEIPKALQIIIIPAIIFILVGIYSNHLSDALFCWMAITNSLILIYIPAYYLFKKNKSGKLSFKNRIKSISLNNKLILFLALAEVVVSLRSFFFIDLHSFGTFFLPIALVVNIVFMAENIPENLSLDKNIWQKAFIIILIAIGTSMSIVYSKIIQVSNSAIITQQGTLYTIKAIADPLNSCINYINMNMPPKASILMIPQGPILNFLTDHPSDNFYYDLLPVNIKIFGESKVVRDLKTNPPDYIFINNRDTRDWIATTFGGDYGREIYQFIIKNYSYEGETGQEFKIKIYKRKG